MQASEQQRPGRRWRCRKRTYGSHRGCAALTASSTVARHVDAARSRVRAGADLSGGQQRRRPGVGPMRWGDRTTSRSTLSPWSALPLLRCCLRPVRPTASLRVVRLSRSLDRCLVALTCSRCRQSRGARRRRNVAGARRACSQRCVSCGGFGIGGWSPSAGQSWLSRFRSLVHSRGLLRLRWCEAL